MNTAQPAPNQRSPLLAIRQKELEIGERVQAAKQAAEQSLLAARHSATEMRDQAEREGRAAALARLQAELAIADVEAVQVRAQSESLADQIAKRGAQRLELAVERILEYVLPKLPGE